MKFNKVIHPEVILDKRGPDMMRETYRRLFEVLRWDDKTGHFQVKTEYEPRFDALFDENSKRHFNLTRYYHQKNGKAFYVGRDFLDAIMKVDKEIPVDYLPEHFIGYFAFPEKSVKDDEHYIQGVYVFVGKLPFKGDKLIFWASYVSETDNPESFFSNNTLVYIDKSMKLGDILKQFPGRDYHGRGVVTPVSEEANEKRNPIFRAALNLVLYVHSQKPDLEKPPVMDNLSHSKRSEYRKGHDLTNECTIPITFVSWRYNRPKEFNIDKTLVTTHLRWQRCGPNYSEIKLVWVREHERHFKKESPLQTPEASPS